MYLYKGTNTAVLLTSISYKMLGIWVCNIFNDLWEMEC